MSTNYQHGSLGTAFVSGQAVCVTGWEMDYVNDLADVTSTCSNGFKEFIKGLSNATGSISGNWDLLANPLQSPFGLVPGVLISPLKLNISTGSFFQFNAYVSDFKATLSVDNVISWSASFQSTGSITLPT